MNPQQKSECDHQTMVAVEGRRVVLRPLRAEDLDAVFIGRMKLAEQGSLASDPDCEELRVRLPGWSRLRDGRANLGIELEGRLIGEVQSFRPRNRTPASGCSVCEVGISIYDPTDRGLGLGTEAVGLFVTWLFREGVGRIEGSTTPANAAMISVFERLGFKRLESNAHPDNGEVRFWLARQ